MGADQPLEALDALSVAARQLQTAGCAEDFLQQIVDMVVATVGACDYAGVSTDRNGRPQSPVVSDPAVLAIDALQYSIDNGPCLDAMRGPEVFIDAADLEHDRRYAAFGPRAAHQGCRAVLAHRLYVDDRTLGALNLYASSPHAYTDADRRQAVVVAALTSLALNSITLELDAVGLREALRTRDLIGQAKGILMERERVGEDAAFERLRRISNDENRRLREVAHDIVDSFATSGQNT